MFWGKMIGKASVLHCRDAASCMHYIIYTSQYTFVRCSGVAFGVQSIAIGQLDSDQPRRY